MKIATPLRESRGLEAVASSSPVAAAEKFTIARAHGALLIVQESRILQISIFEAIQYNLAQINFNTALSDIIIIDDEVDSHLLPRNCGSAHPTRSRRVPDRAEASRFESSSFLPVLEFLVPIGTRSPYVQSGCPDFLARCSHRPH
jgi:hypothetical protein